MKSNNIKITRTSDLVNLTTVLTSLEALDSNSNSIQNVIDKIERVYREVGFEVNGDEVKTPAVTNNISADERIGKLDKLNKTV